MYLHTDAGLFCLFVWWFSTGAIMYLDGLPRFTFKYSLAASAVITLAALAGLAGSAWDTSPHGAYVAFTCGVLAWGWQEISFYMGFVTGPRKIPCPEGCSGWRHFGHAIQVSLWHEISIIASGALVIALTWHAPNQVGAGTFLVLWWMHQSAKINVFLGVRNLNEEFLPDHLEVLKSFLKQKPMNLLFPVSVTVSTVICAIMVQHAIAPGASEFTRTGYTFLATMMGFAILEHWFLVLPLPSAVLWKWSLTSRAIKHPFDVQVVAGFLGAGKTTFLRRVLAQPTTPGATPGRTIVLVNDFAAIGIDGSLLHGQGADVVELPNGCICCSLKADLAAQLNDIVVRFQPQRVLIEPSGVADLAALLRVLDGPALQPLVRSLDVTTVLDAGSFVADFGRMERHLQAQIAPAGRVIINKADLVSPVVLRTVATTVRGIAPGAVIVAARFGLLDEGAISVTTAPARMAISGIPVAASAKVLELPAPGYHDHKHHHGDHQAHAHDDADILPAQCRGHLHGAHEHDEDHDRAHALDLLGLTAWSAPLPANCNAEGLHSLLEAVLAGLFGKVERVKGVARAETGWIRFDVAGGRSSMAAFAAGKNEAARVVAIGRDVDEAKLAAAFEACAIEEAAA